MSAEETTSPLAARSLKLGLLSLVFTVFTGPPAVIQGLRGLLEIRRNPGHLTGRGLALAGIGTGFLGTGLGAVLLMLAVEWVQDWDDRTH
jgi:hypothetical protein